jgi:hypothetical protein
VKRRRQPGRLAGPAATGPDLDGLLYTLRDNLRRADAFITTAERQIEESWRGSLRRWLSLHICRCTASSSSSGATQRRAWWA